MPPTDASPTDAAGFACAWRADAGGWTLEVRGDGRGVPAAPPPPPGGWLPQGRTAFEGRALTGWDPALAARLWALRAELQRRGATVDIDALPAGLREVLALAASEARVAPPAPPAGRGGGWRRPAARALHEAAATVEFLGAVALAIVRLPRERSALRGAEVLRQLDEAGPRSLPVVLLSCALIGLMLAYMGGAQLARIGAQSYLADVVTVGMVRELAGMMTGIVLAGRVGSAIAAQLAAMNAGEEIDALRVLGVDPVVNLVLPRLVGLLAAGPVLIGFGALVGVLAGWPAAVLAYGVSTPEYLSQSLRALTPAHLWIGLFKGQLYVALVALAACREGLAAGRSAEAVGTATTAAVVKSLVWIVAAACATTVVFTSLGF